MRNVHGGKNPEEQQVLVMFATASSKHFFYTVVGQASLITAEGRP